jgi:hypothetical protein
MYEFQILNSPQIAEFVTRPLRRHLVAQTLPFFRHEPLNLFPRHRVAEAPLPESRPALPSPSLHDHPHFAADQSGTPRRYAPATLPRGYHPTA